MSLNQIKYWNTIKSKEDTIIVLLSIDKAEALTLAIKCVIMGLA